MRKKKQNVVKEDSGVVATPEQTTPPEVKQPEPTAAPQECAIKKQYLGLADQVVALAKSIQDATGGIDFEGVGEGAPIALQDQAKALIEICKQYLPTEKAPTEKAAKENEGVGENAKTLEKIEKSKKEIIVAKRELDAARYLLRKQGGFAITQIAKPLSFNGSQAPVTYSIDDGVKWSSDMAKEVTEELSKK